MTDDPRPGSDAFQPIFQNSAAAARYSIFRPRDKIACEEAWRSFTERLAPDLHALVLGPGTGEADVKPLRNVRPRSRIECVGATSHDLSKRSNLEVIAPTWEEWLEGQAWTQASKDRYDLVAACQVFQHAGHWRLMLQAIWQVLKPDGLLVIEDLQSDFLAAIQGFDETSEATRFREMKPHEDLIKWHRRRARNEGIVWWPYFPNAAGSNRLHTPLVRRGFELAAQYPGKDVKPAKATSRISPVTLQDALDGREFGPLAWGSSEAEVQRNKAPTKTIPYNCKNDFDVTTEQRYFAYRKPHGATLIGSENIGFGAFARFERFTRFDLAHDNSNDSTRAHTVFEERYLRSFAQALIQASLLPVSTRIAFLFFGDLDEERRFRQSNIQAAIVDARSTSQQSVTTNLFAHLAYFPSTLPSPSLTTYLLNVFQEDMNFILRATHHAKKASAHRVVEGSASGILIEIPLKPLENLEDHESEEERRQPLSKTLNFPPYIFADYGISPQGSAKNKVWKAWLRSSTYRLLVREFEKLGLPADMQRDLAQYVGAFRYLLRDYDVHILPLFQLLCQSRDVDQIHRRHTGLGSILLCTERQVNARVYPEAFEKTPTCVRSILFKEQLQAVSAIAKHFSQLAIIEQFHIADRKRSALHDAGVRIAQRYGGFMELYEAALRIAKETDPLTIETTAFDRAVSRAEDAFPRNGDGSSHDLPGAIALFQQNNQDYLARVNKVREGLLEIERRASRDDGSKALVEWVLAQQDVDFLHALKALQRGSMVLHAFCSAADRNWMISPPLDTKGSRVPRFRIMLAVVMMLAKDSKVTCTLNAVNKDEYTAELIIAHPTAKEVLEAAKACLDGTKSRGGGMAAEQFAQIVRGALGVERSEDLQRAALETTSQSYSVTVPVRDMLKI